MTADHPNAGRDRILAVLMTAVLMSMLCVTIINVALPSLERDLGASAADLQWVLAGYSLVFGVLLVPAGRAGDLFGHGRLFLVGVALFTLSSLAAALAPSILAVNLARVVMGVGAGLFNPQVMGLIQQHFRDAERARAFGIYGAVTAVGAALGPVIGGALLTWLPQGWGWRATFAVTVPFGAFALVLAWRWLPAPARRRARQKPDLDPVGAVLLGAATLALMVPFVGAPWWIGVGSLALGWVFVAWERRYRRRGRSPMLALSLFADRAFSMGLAVFTLFFTGTITLYVVQTLFIQQGLGGSALLAGAVALPPALVTAYGSKLGPELLPRFGGRVVTGALVLVLLGLAATIAVMFLVVAGASIWWNAVTMSVLGLGMGMVNSTVQTRALTRVPVESAGAAGGVLQTGQRVGSAIGFTAIPGIWFATAHLGPATAHAFAYAAIGVLVVAALIAATADDLRR